MTIRRVDSYQIKPGQEHVYFSLLADFAQHLERHGAKKPILTRTSSGGSEAGIFHAFADYDSMAAYGAFIDAAVDDDDLQACYAEFFDADAPGAMVSSNLMIRLGAFGAEEPLNPPSAAAVVRTWAVAPGCQSVVTESIEQIAGLYGDTGGHWNVWDMYAAGHDGAAQVMTAAVFPSVAALGAYVDDMRCNPRVAEIILATSSLEQAPKMLGASIVRVIAY